MISKYLFENFYEWIVTNHVMDDYMWMVKVLSVKEKRKEKKRKVISFDTMSL